jgi:MYXO-CTERM domain-containing protein
MLSLAMKTWVPFLLTLSVSVSAAAVTQPNGKTIPVQSVYCDGGKTAGLAAVFACICEQPGVCNIGDPCPGNMDPNSCDDGQNGTCESTLWHDWNQDPCIPKNLSGLDPVADADTQPETFRPVCPMAFRIESRGTAMFRDIFGWYNVTGSKPSVDDLHVMLDCNTVAGDTVSLDLQSEPDYLGGEIGFFLATPQDPQMAPSCSGGNCCATLDRIKNGEGFVYYSEPKYNPDTPGQIHLLTYDSRLFDYKFYFAWEDIYGGDNDDFTDLVTSVSGIQCSGGGLPCDTGEIGLCSYGITECDANGNVVCTQVFTSSNETCDAVDNDCDGVIDDDATCPDNGICHNGRCVKNCSSGEFPCQGAFTKCDFESGLCVPEDCIGVTCPSDKVCRGSECVAPCDGVTCPWGQTCIGDVCLDPCENISCGTGQVCRGGACFDGCGQCSGATCETPLRCDTSSGECYDPSCASGCPSGQHCSAGSCVSNCDGAVCPGGAPCVDGKCQVPGTTGPTDAGFDSGTGGSGGSPLLDGGPNADGAAGAGNGSSVYSPDDNGGCGCHVPASRSQGGLAALALSLLGLLLARRKR